MLNKTLYQIIIILSIAGLILPSFGFTQEQFGATTPQTVEEAKNFGMTILSKLPDAVKKVWQEEAMPILQKMWEWFWPFLEPWRQKLVDLLSREIEKRRPAIEEEIKKEIKEEIKETAPVIGKSLWNKFKDLLTPQN